MAEISYRRHRFPPVVIQHAVWLYLRFTLSYRDVEELLAERGLDISYESVRSWVLKFGPMIARRLRQVRPRPSDRWHLDEMVVRIAGKRMYLWRAVDHEGEILDVLVQRRRDRRAAVKLMRKLMRKQGFAPKRVAMLNSNKRAITLNLKHERGRALLFCMVERGDVLLENFAPGVMDRLGVGWEVLHRINPRLVYASGSGYGLTGPDRDNLAMDLTIQAVSGLIAATGFPDGPPVKAGPAVVDFISGIHLYAATLTALFERERTGSGRLVEVAMQEAAYATLTSQLHAYFETGKAAPRTGNASHGRVPLNVYPTKDGYVAMNIAVEEHWHNLLSAMGREDLRDDPRYVDNAARVANRGAVDALVAAWTRTIGKMEAFAIAKRHRIPLAPVREVDEVMADRHMHERGMLEWIEHDEIGRIVVPTTPLRIHGAGPVDTVPSPKLGQHNREIYGDWLGLSAAEITALEQEGVI